MTTNPVTVAPSDSVAVAKKTLGSGEIHHLVVVEDGLIVGIVSSSDLLKFHLLDRDAATLSSTTVAQMMELEPVVLQSNASLHDAATALSIGGYHALPVVDQNRKLVGIVTSVDLVIHLLKQIPRGDGSIRSKQAENASHSRISDSDVSRVIKQAEQGVSQDGEIKDLSRALLHFRDRNRLLEGLRKAAELYLRSGHGEHEHSVLVKCLADLQRR